MSSKFLFLLFLISSSYCDDYFRPFFENFFREARGVELNESCLTGDFDIRIKNLTDEAKKYNPSEVLLLASPIMNHINESCDLNEFTYLLAELQNKIDSGDIYYIILKNIYYSVETVVNELNNKDATSRSFGRALGKAIHPFVAKNENQTEIKKLRNLRGKLEKKFKEGELWEVVAGIAVGLDKDDQHVCMNAILTNKDKFKEAIKEIMQMIVDEEDIMDIIDAILSQFQGIKEIFTECRIKELIELIKYTATPEGFGKVKERFMDRLGEIIGAVVDIIIAARDKNYGELGENVGKIIKLLFDFYVN